MLIVVDKLGVFRIFRLNHGTGRVCGCAIYRPSTLIHHLNLRHTGCLMDGKLNSLLFPPIVPDECMELSTKHLNVCVADVENYRV